MREEIADVAIKRVSNFTVGFGRAGEKPAAKGSGVLVKYADLFGILTCAHVDSYLRTLPQPVGLVRLNRGLMEQFGTIDLNAVMTHALGKEPWIAGEEDLAFIQLPAHLVGNIEKDCVFLDAKRNFTKLLPDNDPSLISVHAVFGLVEDFTGETTRQNGRATTRLRAVLTSGDVRDFKEVSLTLECFDLNLPDLPRSLGGTSGGGLWRVYIRKNKDGVLRPYSIDYSVLHQTKNHLSDRQA